jgi:hypothetical protein
MNILQLVFLNSLSEISSFGWDPHIGRLTGSFLDPNFMAYYLCLYYVINHFFLKKTLIEYISLISVFLTLSRNGILTLIIIFLICNIRNFKKILLLSLIGILFILINPRLVDRFLQFQDRNDSSYVRVASWNEALKVTFLNNFSGIGFNNYKNNLEFYRVVPLDSLNKNSVTSTDSSYLHIFVTLGVVGIFLFSINLISFVFLNGVIKSNLVVLISLMFNSQFINSLFYPQISFILFVILFLGLYFKENNI